MYKSQDKGNINKAYFLHLSIAMYLTQAFWKTNGWFSNYFSSALRYSGQVELYFQKRLSIVRFSTGKYSKG